MPSSNDPTRATQPLADQAPRVDGDHGRDEVNRLTTAADHDVESQPTVHTAVGPLPQKVRSFEDERDIVGALPESTLAQSSIGRYDAHREADASNLGSETARRQAITASLHEAGVEHRAVGRNPLAEAIFGESNPHAEGPAEEVKLPNQASSDLEVASTPTSPTDDPRLQAYPPGPQPVDYLSDVNPETAEVEAIVAEDEGAQEAEAAVEDSEDAEDTDAEHDRSES